MEIEKISLLPKVMDNDEIIKALEDKEIHYVSYGIGVGIARMELMRLTRTNGQLVALWDIERHCERLLHVNNIINVGGVVTDEKG